ncbi:hypothetical protein AB9K41_31210 [Cribrihabitans sp. XS_ASV171]
MFDFPTQPAPLHDFLTHKSEELQNVALLLGGRPWLGRVQRFIGRANNETLPSRKTVSELHQIRDLLHLEHVDDFERPESAYFAELDLNAPYINDICLLAEEADALLGNIMRVSKTAKVAKSEVL